VEYSAILQNEDGGDGVSHFDDPPSEA
jgi:hypothetical protein